MPENKPTGGVEEGKALAALAYFWILFLIPLLAKRDSDFAVFHGKQGLVLFIYSIIISAIGYIPVIGWVISWVGGIFGFVLFIIGLINALSGKREPLPVIGKYGENIKI
jgi:uncharacterized membrane protein